MAPDPIVVALRDRRRQLELPLNEVAHRLRVSRTAVAGWESGLIEPSLDALHHWAQALGAAITVVEVADDDAA